jgi:hypothetical protein
VNDATSNPLTINNCTFTGNSATNNGGGIRNNRTLNINHSIIAGNTAASGAEVYNTGTINANNYNVFSHSGLTTAQAFFGFTPGTNDYNASSDASNTALNSTLNTTLADNGGPTWTHALITGSPAIDYAPSTACTSSPVNGIDQRGAVRNYDGDGQGSTGNECDSGAYEYRAPTQQCGLTLGIPVTVENVTFNFTNLGTLTCVTVDEMGPSVNHLLATGPGASGVGIQTGNWWHISGNGSGFSVSITLPYGTADNNSRVCKYPGNLGGYGWDCDDGTNTTYVSNASVTRSGVTSFSDWAVGDYVGPTALHLTYLNGHTLFRVWYAIIAVTAIMLCSTALAALWYSVRKHTVTHP